MQAMTGPAGIMIRPAEQELNQVKDPHWERPAQKLTPWCAILLAAWSIFAIHTGRVCAIETL